MAPESQRPSLPIFSKPIHVVFPRSGELTPSELKGSWRACRESRIGSSNRDLPPESSQLRLSEKAIVVSLS